MDIQEVKQLKENLEAQIAQMLADFETKTELYVTGLVVENLGIVYESECYCKKKVGYNVFLDENLRHTVTIKVEF